MAARNIKGETREEARARRQREGAGKRAKSEPSAPMLGGGLANVAGRLLGSRQQAVESAVTKIPTHKQRKQ